MSGPREVLAFWFGEPAHDDATFRAKIRRWYMGGSTLDREISEQFGAVIDEALAGRLERWADSPRDRVALIVVLDQFTRSIYRDDPQTYAGDEAAQAVTVDALDRGLECELSIEERLFLNMPLLHAESLDHQERGVREMERLVAEAPAWAKPVLAMGVEQAHKYRGVIARFGRFPHRNQILGRASTPDEAAFLVDWKQRQPPTGAHDPPA
ncbi:MAG: DUF924 domain-containing protein [Deltaproteobacteria bacterium]|nr:DUF924 domain-containing protein [Deltaproteobacteria bacterium]MDQ3300601.1 DUF924 domain-containing protein [Myxococcota bacterium]